MCRCHERLCFKQAQFALLRKPLPSDQLDKPVHIKTVASVFSDEGKCLQNPQRLCETDLILTVREEIW